MITTVETAYDDRIERIRPIIEKYRDTNETERRLAPEVVEALRNEGFYRLLKPKAYGGDEIHPVEAYKVWESLGKIDSCVGWNLQIASWISLLGTRLDPAGVEEMYDVDPDGVSAGAFFPPAIATRVDGGFRVTGRSPFASGCHAATWLVFMFVEMDGENPVVDATGAPVVRAGYFHKDDVEIIDTWNTLGMRGTGSCDIAIQDVLVPDRRCALVAPLDGDVPEAFINPMYRTMPWPGIHGETLASLGVAAAAIEAFVDLAATKVPAMASTGLRDREMAQTRVAEACALLQASRASLYDSINHAIDVVEREGQMSPDAKHRCQMAATFAARSCAQAVDLVFEAAGSSSIRLENEFGRYLRDAHVMTQHGSKAVNRYTDVGKQMLGLETDYLVLTL